MGSLMFSMVETRPNIAFPTSVASRFAKNPGYQHTEAMKTILRYLKGSNKRGIIYSGQSKLLVEGYSNSDWAGDKKNRKSTSGFIFMLNGDPVSWCSKRQLTVVLSSTEAKYIALTIPAKKATWLRLLLTELGFLQPNQQHALIKILEANTCAQAIQQDLVIANAEKFKSRFNDGVGNIVILLKSDNQGLIALAYNPVFHSRTKYIDIQHYYICNKVASQRIQLFYVPTEEMIADDLTKALTHVKFHRFIEQMGMT